MEWGKNITGHLAVSMLVAAIMSSMLCVAQKVAPHAPPPRPVPTPQQHMSRPQTAPTQQRGDASEWLRRYKDLAPDEREKTLQNGPAFQKLPQPRQQLLRQRLQRFSG